MAEQQVSNDYVLSNPGFTGRTDPMPAHHAGRCALQLLCASLHARADAGEGMGCEELHGAGHIIKTALETWEKGWDEIEELRHQA